VLGTSGFKASAQSCCCTGMGSSYSILPNLDKHIIGAKWSYSRFHQSKVSLNPDLNGVRYTEQVNTLELFGRFNLNRRFQLSVLIPVSAIHQYSRLDNTHNAGLGDMSFVVQYALLDPLKCNGKKSKHQIRLGLGTKLPSGQFEKSKNDLYNTSVQLGSGSIDFLANAIYTYRYKKIGLNARAAYKLNTANPQTFRFGDKADAELNMFYVVKAGKLNFMPTAGLLYAHLFNNYNHGQPVYESNSDLLAVNVSLNATIAHLVFDVSVQPVIYNRVNLMAYRQRFTTTAGMFYTF
jgi:hypothetical protein